ncbi:MAG: putative peroxiredoxin [Owenweeksia sp. TMED14]|nr:MAG: putative peroxiredoxin [Owenweeksia sp. TMED14]|tara:strand:- start:3012 stop:3641 length:630 start_codon:yes stop_codon:yes gene_type:complete
MSQVGKKFPNISVNAMNEMGDTFKLNVLHEALDNKKKIILFWYPKDFTFVCPTEIHAFQAKASEFEKRNTMVIGASCDTAEVHFAWLSTAKDNGGIEGVTFPLLADSNRQLAETLDILDTQFIGTEDDYVIEGDNVTYRATYLIDEKGTIFHESVNVMPLGRNVDEYLRLIDGYTHNQVHGEVCPANWEEGKDTLSESRDSVASYLAKH